MSWKAVCGIVLAGLMAIPALASTELNSIQATPMRALEVEKRADGIRFNLELAPPQVADVPIGDSWGQVLEIPGADMLEEPGKPDVPVLARLFRMPPAGGAQAVILNSSYETMSGIEYAAYAGMDGEEMVFGDLDDTMDEWYPGNLAEVTEPAIARDFRVASLVTYPVQVNAFRHEVRVYSNIDVDVEYGGPGVNELDQYPTALSESYLSFYREFLDWDDNELDNFEVYIGAVEVVAKQAALDQMGSWITWKRQKGYKLDFITEAEVPSWTSTNIKSTLQNRWNAAQYKFDWVVVVGDNTGTYATPPGSGQGDQFYVKLSGNDELPEAGIGRISVESQTQLLAYVNKVLKYESDPYMDDTSWYKRGMVAAGSSSSGISTIYLARSVRLSALNIGYTQVDTAWYTQGGVNNTIINRLNAGTTFYSYRGYLGSGPTTGEIDALTNTYKLTVAQTITCSEGNWVSSYGKNEAFMRAGTVNAPTGGIGGLATATSSTHTRYNNALLRGSNHSILDLRNRELGGTIFWSKVWLYKTFVGTGNDTNIANFAEWCNLMGDPCVWIWTDIPATMNVSHPTSILYGRHGFEVVVTDGGNHPVPSAWVCLYKNDASDDTVAFGLTDGDGRIVLDPPFEDLGSAKLTVTKQNMHPYQANIACEMQTLMAVENVVMVDDGSNGTQGNGNGIAEPGETVGLRLTFHNLYAINAPRVGAIFTSDDPMIAQTGGIAQFGNMSAHQVRTATSLVYMQIADDAQNDWNADGEIGIGIIPQGGGQPNVMQTDIYSFKIQAPAYSYINQHVTGTIVPGATVTINFDVKNVGLMNGVAGAAQLVSDDSYLIVNSPQQTFPACNIGQTVTTANYSITAHPESFKGYPARALLVIGNAGGFLDTVKITIPLGIHADTDPIGPDAYGYIAFDNRDVAYDIAPVYDWIEVNPSAPNNDYPGTLLNIHDTAEEDDDVDVVDLPFPVQFYGIDYTRGAVTCDGVINMGNQGDMRNSRNYPMPGPGGHEMVAPFWDDRKIGAGGGVYEYYDQPNGRYIVEWYNVADITGQAATTKFEVIFYDQVGEHITISGDNHITFQYADVTPTIGDNTDNQYFTTGIQNKTANIGLQVTYWDSDNTPNAEVTENRAILFTTQAALITGTLTGTVTLATGGAPVEAALVHTADGGYEALTNAQGNYTINDIVIGHHNLVVERQGINTQTVPIEIFENQTTTRNFSVTAPGFELSVEEINEVLPPDDQTTTTVTISNPGDGLLSWTVDIDNAGPGQEIDNEWDLLDQFPLTGPDNRNRGIAFHKGFYWLAGSNNQANPNGLYRISTDGVLQQSYAQPVPNPSQGGFYGMATDGDYLYGVDNGILYQLFYDPLTQEVSLASTLQLPVELSIVRYLTYDPDNDVFWMGERYTPVYAVTRAGTIVAEYVTGMSILSMSWYGDDPDGYYLYFTLQETPYVDITVMKMQPSTGNTMFVTNIVANVYQVKDIHITYLWDPFFWVLMILKDGSALHDKVEVYEIGPNNAWMNLNSNGGDIPAGGNFDLLVSLASLDLPEGVYSSWLRFDNNTFTPQTYLPVTLTISANASEVAFTDGDTQVPLEWKFNGVYPNPFNPTTTISFTMKHTAEAKALLYNVLGQKVATLADGPLPAGQHSLTIDGNNLASGVYFLRFQAGPMQETRKVVLLR